MLNKDELENLLRFVGYGTLSGPIWFLGMEEAFTPRSGFNHEDNLRIRAAFPPVIDVQEAHTLMQAEYWEGGSVDVSHVWKWAAKLTRALIHRTDDCLDVWKANEYI